MLKKKELSLKFIWGIRLRLSAKGNKLRAKGDKLRAEGDKLRAEGDELWAEGNKLLAKSNKLRAEGNKLRAEGDELWAESIIEVYGNIKLKWRIKNGKQICTLETGEEFSE